MSRKSRIIASSLIVILAIIICARFYNRGGFNDKITNNALVGIILIGLIGLNYVANQELLDDPLVIINKLFDYPRYRLALFGVGTITALALIDNAFDKLIACFAISSICLGRDHRWAAFAAMDMLIIVIIMLLIHQQGLADSMAIYLYYFLVIATLTMIINPSSSHDVIATHHKSNH